MRNKGHLRDTLTLAFTTQSFWSGGVVGVTSGAILTNRCVHRAQAT